MALDYENNPSSIRELMARIGLTTVISKSDMTLDPVNSDIYSITFSGGNVCGMGFGEYSPLFKPSPSDQALPARADSYNTLVIRARDGWYHDLDTNTLHVKYDDWASISEIYVNLWLFVKTGEAKVGLEEEGGIYYTHWEGRLEASSSFEESIEDILEGRLSVASANISLNNVDKRYSHLVTGDYAWRDRPVNVWRSINEIENRQLIFSGSVDGVSFNGEDLNISVKSAIDNLKRDAVYGEGLGYDSTYYYADPTLAPYANMENKRFVPIPLILSEIGVSKISGKIVVNDTAATPAKIYDMGKLDTALVNGAINNNYSPTVSTSTNEKWITHRNTGSITTIDITTELNAATVTLVKPDPAITGVYTVTGFSDSDRKIKFGLCINATGTGGLSGYYAVIDRDFDAGTMLLRPIQFTTSQAAITGPVTSAIAHSGGIFSDGVQDVFLSPDTWGFQPYVGVTADKVKVYQVDFSFPGTKIWSSLGPLWIDTTGSEKFGFFNIDPAKWRFYFIPIQTFSSQPNHVETKFILKDVLTDCGLTPDDDSFDYFFDNFGFELATQTPEPNQSTYLSYLNFMEPILEGLFSAYYSTTDGKIGIRHISDYRTGAPITTHSFGEADIEDDSIKSEYISIDLYSKISLKNDYVNKDASFYTNSKSLQLYGSKTDYPTSALENNTITVAGEADEDMAESIGKYRTNPRIKYTFKLPVKGYDIKVGDYIDLDLSKYESYLGSNPNPEVIVLSVEHDIDGITVVTVERDFI